MSFRTNENSIVVYTDTVQRKKVSVIDPIVEKYAHLLKVDKKTVKNVRLYHFIEEWIGTPYKWGGADKDGIDCSAFVQRLLKEVYAINIPRTSIEQLLTERIEPYRSKDFLSEGDLIFFRTLAGTYVSHVGLYLQNGMFINASSKGVSLARLNDLYWKKSYVAAGRVKVK
jgi:lipoprotein Spr